MGIDYFKDNPRFIIKALKTGDFKYKVDEKVLKTIGLPHNRKVRLQIIHHFALFVIIHIFFFFSTCK